MQSWLCLRVEIKIGRRYCLLTIVCLSGSIFWCCSSWDPFLSCAPTTVRALLKAPCVHASSRKCPVWKWIFAEDCLSWAQSNSWRSHGNVTRYSKPIMEKCQWTPTLYHLTFDNFVLIITGKSMWVQWDIKLWRGRGRVSSGGLFVSASCLQDCKSTRTLMFYLTTSGIRCSQHSQQMPNIFHWRVIFMACASVRPFSLIVIAKTNSDLTSSHVMFTAKVCVLVLKSWLSTKNQINKNKLLRTWHGLAEDKFTSLQYQGKEN